MNTILLIIMFLLVILGLLFFIRKQLRSEKERKEKIQDELDKAEEAARKHKAYLIESIQIIAKGVLEEQCGVTEGCIRLKVLIENIAPHLLHHADLKAIQLIFDKTSHIPLLNDWKALTASEKETFLAEMADIEKMYRSDVQAAAHFILQYPFNQTQQ
ncbi:DUF2489 domain-containing protein [Nitrincola nitratireducens]|uniref:DUF2489 domain-containing protein n=1 Tax=Nitrincola nitratireducens TaxID=1229521 RepID=W9UZY4_9GAMM|nr:DUF2489 domain-containing protein [Nitrincola nitratireducens]EXJ09417.1 hypothetical protein D791_03700 [Nitrincola nitratireducens]